MFKSVMPSTVACATRILSNGSLWSGGRLSVATTCSLTMGNSPYLFQRENSNARWKKLHQFLSDIGVKALRTHLGQLLGIARISKSKDEYEEFFQRLFGEQFTLFDDEPTGDH